MYKTRFRDWKLKKNAPQRVIKAVVRKRAERGEKPSEFIWNDVPISEKNMQNRKAKRLLADFEALQERSPTPEGLLCHTPLVSPPATPLELRIPEHAAKTSWTALSAMGPGSSTTTVTVRAKSGRVLNRIS